jgi:hypothetical protein
MDWHPLVEALGLRVPSPLRIALCVFAMLAFVAAIAFLSYAGFLAMATTVAAPWAAVVVAGGALSVAGFSIILAVSTDRRRTAAQPSRVQPEDLSHAMFAELIRGVQSCPKEAAALALIAGLGVGLYPDLMQLTRKLTQSR